jgi:hypothetical protein
MDRTDYRYNLEYRATVRARMLVLARGLVSGDLGVVAASRELMSYCDVPEPEIGAVLKVFVGIHSETDALPIGKVRSLWNSEALAREDLKIKAAEQRWHDQAVTAATQRIHLLEKD